MIEACGNVRGLNILDCGCGEGRFSRMLVGLGTEHVLGLDLCPPMIQAAKELATGKDTYAVADVQDLSFLGDRSFDLVVSYVNQCYLPDVQANNREVFRVLRPGGRFVVANLHPIRSAAGGCQKSDEGATQDAILDRYLQEGERRWTSIGVEFTIFHWTFSTYIRGYRQAGFAIEEIIEPTVTAEALARFPELDDKLRVYDFIIFVLGKPPNGVAW